MLERNLPRTWGATVKKRTSQRGEASLTIQRKEESALYSEAKNQIMSPNTLTHELVRCHRLTEKAQMCAETHNIGTKWDMGEAGEISGGVGGNAASG